MKPLLHLFFVQLLLVFTGGTATALSPLLDIWKTWPSPHEFVQMIDHLNITGNCRAHTMEFLFRLTSQEYVRQSPWALQMIDSWGKVPEGILRGHLNSFGDYHECVSVDVSKLQFLGYINKTEPYSTKFRGLYCTVALQLPLLELPSPTVNTYLDESNQGDLVQKFMDHLPISGGVKMFPSVGLCFPSSCSTTDVNTFVGHITPKIVPSATGLVLGECSTARSSNFDAGFWVVIGAFSLLLAITAIGTALDLFQTKQRREEVRGSTCAVMTTLQSFSVARNIQNLLKTKPTVGLNLECLHGIRFLTMLWVTLNHTWYAIVRLPVWNAVEAEEWTWNLYSSPIVNGTVALDTFITVTGLLVGYSLLKLCETTKGRLPFLWLYLHRFLRLTPAYAVVVGVVANVLPYLGSGPLWYALEREGANCRAHWWTNLLYLNNFIHPKEMCAPHGWYLAVDMQLYILAPLIVLPMWRYRRAGVALLSVVTMLAILPPGLQTHFQHFQPTSIHTRDFDVSNYSDLYIKPWTYLQSYLVGIWLGYYLSRNSGTAGVNLSRLQVATGWLLSTVVALAVLYGINPWFDPRTEIPHTVGCLYASLYRFAWGICICWVIYACSHGYGGYINRFLSWKPFIPLGRLTYCAYLVSMPIMTIFNRSTPQPLYYSFYSMIYVFFGHAVMCVGASFILTTLFESPFIQLEKLVRTRNSHKST